jgi:WD40 repeat protein
VECSPDGKFVFLGSSTSKIYAFDLALSEMTQRLSGHHWEVWQLEQLTSPGHVPLLASGSYDHKINLWSFDAAEEFKLLKSLDGHKGAVHSLRCFSNKLFSGSGDRSIRVWGEKK